MAGYSTKQSVYADSNIIYASLFNTEFDAIVNAFHATTGHTHDGTAGEGGAITSLRGMALTFGDGTAATDIVITFDGETNDGVLRWLEDEDYFQFDDGIMIQNNEPIYFRDTAIHIQSTSDGVLNIVSDNEVDIAATTLDINASVDADGATMDLTATGAASLGSGSTLSLSGTTEVDITTALLDVNGDLDVDGAVIALDATGAANLSSGTTLSLSGTTEVDITTALLDVNGSVDVDGTTVALDATGAANLASGSTLSLSGTTEVDITTATLDINGDIDADGSSIDLNATGTLALTGTTLDLNGNVDIDGTTVTIDANTAITGDITLEGNFPTGTDNTVIGSGAAAALDPTSARVIAIGAGAGAAITTGTDSIAIGEGAGATRTTAQFNIHIGTDSGAEGTTTGHQVFMGYQAGQFNTGNNNTCVGSYAGKGATGVSTGNFLTAFGYNALSSATSGAQNVAVGSSALFDLTTGDENVAVGHSAAPNVTTGDSNTVVGHNAGSVLTTGSRNTFMGKDAGAFSLNNTDDNVCLGYHAGRRIDDNRVTFVGAYAGHGQNPATGGSESVGIGYGALQYLSTSVRNTAVGYRSLNGTTTGSDNIAIGHNAILQNAVGGNNIVVGSNSYTSVASGSFNVVVGNSSALSLTSGTNNTFVGYATAGLCTGSSNTFIGSASGDAMSSGDGNVILGAFDGLQGGLDIRTSDNNIVLSSDAGEAMLHINSAGDVGFMYPSTSGEWSTTSGGMEFTVDATADCYTINWGTTGTIGNKTFANFYDGAGTACGSIVVDTTNNEVDFNTTSDYRLKENVVELTGATERLNALQPKRFNFIGKPNTVDGFLAHEAQEVVPNAVTGIKDGVEMQAIDHSKLVPLLTAAFQEAVAKIENLEQRLSALES